MLVAVVIATAVFASTAAAFTIRNSGFTATAYASPFPVDGSGRGARASAWEGNVLWIAANGGLYRADAGAGGPGPLTSLTPTLVGPVAGGLNGVALSGGRVYATLVDARQVVELDKTTGAVLRVVASGVTLSPRSLAADPLTGDLIVTGASKLWRLANPSGAAPGTSIYASLPGSAGTRAIAIGPDGTIFVVNDFDQLFLIESTAVAAGHVGNANASPMGTPVSGMVGIAVITNGVDGVPQFLMLSTNGGAVWKTPAISGASGDTIQVLDGAGTGDQLSVGPDACVYASMDGSVLRVADAAGTCQLSIAGITPPALTIDNTTGQPARVNSAVTLNARLTHAATLAGHVVTFQVTGANPRTITATTNAGGNATASYTGTAVGADTIVATTTADGFPLTSNTLTITWLPEPDQSPPRISFSYTVASGGTGAGFACDTTRTSASFPSGTLPEVGCGWFTSVPTLHFTVTPTGTSGLGLLSNCGDYALNYQPPAQGHAQTCRAYNGDGLASATLTIVINAVLSPPSVIPSAVANAAPYAAGALTRGPVTVHFDCSASPIQVGLVCPADQTFSGTGVYSATGTATDIAGQTTTASFGPIDIDATPPTIGVSAGTYVFGTWTNADVPLTFSCADNRGVATCPAPRTVNTRTAGVSVVVTDLAGNSTGLTTGAIEIDKTPPLIVASARTADGLPYVAGTPTRQNVTVSYACATDAAPITSCAPDATFALEGSSTATGAAADAAGNSATAALGPIVIDRTAPTIAAAVTVGGLPYDGSWTRGPVVVRFTCADDVALGTCPADVTLIADRDASVSGSAADAAGNTATVTTAAIRIDRTPPVTTATLAGTTSGPDAYLFTVTVTLTAVDAGSGVSAINYALDGGPAVTVAAATATFVVSTEGSHTVAFGATDAVGNAEADRTRSFSVIFRQHTTLTITSAPFLATGTPITARLANADVAGSVAGEAVTFIAGGVTRTAVTDAAGVATADLGLAPGAYLVSATYAGTPRYFPSADERPAVVYALTRFVVWGPNAALGARVQFWGDDWAKQIADKSARKALDAFKGYAETVTGDHWSARGGDKVKPPRTVPRYIGVIVTYSASRSHELVTGSVTAVAVLRVSGREDDDGSVGVTPRVGERAFGTVLAVVD